MANDKKIEGAMTSATDRMRGAGEAMQASGKKAAEGGATISARLIDQAETNARQAFAAMRDAAKANDINGVMQIQSDYLRDQAQRSVDQAREIGELIMQFGRDAVSPLTDQKK